LNVRAKETITPRQVALLEEFVQREMGQPFTLVFSVGQVEEIRREESNVKVDKWLDNKLKNP
jgi:hypothetical protein